MKILFNRLILTAVILLFSVVAYGQSVEHGVVKEYRGERAKQPLPGVEVMVKGAPSSISDQSGSFALRFATLGPGDKVDYSEIYKEGYVIFNKDALDAWRISNNEKPFTIVMCKESDFRVLKKKFYGIIERSYRAEFEKQRVLAEQSAANELELNNKLKQLEKEYNEKLGNINTYVELFSRIDRSEMDSIESKSLRLIELGEIDKAISVYEELQLSRQIQGQMSKWDSGIAMVSAGNNMIEQVKSDLMTLVGKMQKQIGLYEMGGSEYAEKRKALVEEIIPVLYRLNTISDGHYNETLGQMIIERSKYRKWSERVTDYREAAAIPSVVGLSSMGNRYEMLAFRNHEYSDSARMQYKQILELCQPDDPIKREILQRLVFIPKGVYKANDGNEYPFGFWGDNNSEVYLCGRSRYVSTHLEGDAKLPDEIIYHGQTYPVTAIAYFAFGNNRSLRKATLPKQLKMVSDEAFTSCSRLDTIVAPPTLDQLSYHFNHETVVLFPEGCENIDLLSSLYNNLANSYPDAKQYAGAKKELLKTHARECAKIKETELSRQSFQILIFNMVEKGDTISALNFAKENVKLNRTAGELWLGHVYHLLRDPDNASLHYKKALKTGDPYAYNQMAYVYALPEYKRQNFKKAYKYIDLAIEKNGNDSTHLPDLLDTKGELYLLEGKVDDAKRSHDEISALYPKFYDLAESKLHTYFCPVLLKSSTTDNQEAKPNNDPTNLQNYIDIVQMVARKEYVLLNNNLENFRSADYEELLSIGIIALQVLIKNKTPEQLERYNTIYLATAVSWAIRNEMRLRYDWYSSLGPSPSWETRFTKECENTRIDPQRLSVIYAIYLGIKDLYYTALDHEQTNKPVFKEIQHYWNLINKAKEQMDGDQRDFVNFLLSHNSNVAEIEKRFSLPTIVNSINIIKDTFNANNGFGYGLFSSSNVTTSSDNESATTDSKTADSINNTTQSGKALVASNKQLQTYLDLVKIVTDNEMRYVERFGMNFDREELLSIGIIAVQVLIKNKTPEQLEKYNTIYLATVISWAIRNELSIRHKKYSQESKSLEFHVDDSISATRMMVYYVVKDIYHNQGGGRQQCYARNQVYDGKHQQGKIKDVGVGVGMC